ncbi:beta strand repeat-containing protein, partial [Bradyrhizobium sp.]|uniref:beta strand repeat-containing protein n=1 Tax=Bradyrhizobium sp. TaxID=376 RepID=UPI003C7423D7
LDITSDPVINTGILQAIDDSTLKLTTLTVTNTGGTVTVDNGSTLDLADATIDGGTLGGTGTIATAAGNTDSTLNGVTIASGSKVAAAVGTLDLTGIITNKGEIDATSGTLDLENATVNGGTLGGTGTIATAAGNTDSTLNGVTIASGSKVAAAVGTLDLTGIVTNKGEIDATSGTLDLENATINGGTLGGTGTIATAAGNTDSTLNGVTIAAATLVTAAVGTLDLTGIITNTGGEIDAGATGTLDLENATVNGGTLGGTGTIATAAGNTDSTLNGVTIASGSKVAAAVGTLDLTGIVTNKGEIDATSGTLDLENATINGGTLGGAGTIATVSGADTLNNVAIAGGTTVKVTDITALDLKGTIANGGTIALNSSGDTTQLEISGIVLLNGSGQVTLTDNTHNMIVSDGLAATLTNSDTITGAGTIGDALLTLVNNGTIDATGTHLLTIDTGINTPTSAGPAGSHWTVGSLTVTNNAGGILEASAGHTLQIDDSVLNNGLIEAGNTALVNVTGNITGTGSIEIFNNAKLEIGGSVSSGQTVTFGVPHGTVATAATLILDDSHDFKGTIVGLTENSNENLENHIDLKDLAFRAGNMHVSFADGVVTVSNGIDHVTLNVSGNSSGSFELAADAAGANAGTLLDDPPPSGMVTIDSGQTLDITAASTATVSFTNSNGNTGELVLDNSKAFTGQIVGFAGDGTTSNSDLINLTDVNIADVAINKTTYTDNGNGAGTLTLYDANGQALDSLTFAGSYQLANFIIESDGSGHTLIVDPPASASQSVGGIVMQDPGPAASSTIVATAPNQALTGLAPSDNFAFNFAGVGHAIVTDFHPATDTLQFSNPIFASAQAAFDATHDDGHGNSVVAIDAHDTITLAGILKAQLHVGDFHIV